jgi:hypothetical protein
MTKISATFLAFTLSFFPGMISCRVNQEKKQNIQDDQVNAGAPFYGGAITLDHPRISKVYDSSKVEHYFPFIIYKDGTYMIAAEIEHEPLYTKYSPVFEKYGFSGNGYSWENVIRQMLEKGSSSLLPHIKFDPEAGGFYVFADSEQSQRSFAAFVSGMFKDTTRLSGFLRTAKKSIYDE